MPEKVKSISKYHVVVISNMFLSAICSEKLTRFRTNSTKLLEKTKTSQSAVSIELRSVTFNEEYRIEIMFSVSSMLFVFRMKEAFPMI